jgi:hypothetical protein
MNRIDPSVFEGFRGQEKADRVGFQARTTNVFCLGLITSGYIFNLLNS